MLPQPADQSFGFFFPLKSHVLSQGDLESEVASGHRVPVNAESHSLPVFQEAAEELSEIWLLLDAHSADCEASA